MSDSKPLTEENIRKYKEELVKLDKELTDLYKSKLDEQSRLINIQSEQSKSLKLLSDMRYKLTDNELNRLRGRGANKALSEQEVSDLEKDTERVSNDLLKLERLCSDTQGNVITLLLGELRGIRLYSQINMLLLENEINKLKSSPVVELG